MAESRDFEDAARQGQVEDIRQSVDAAVEPPRSRKRKVIAPDATEDTTALIFTARYRDQLRFDHDAGAWFEWSGTHWQRDNRQRAFTYARDCGRDGGSGRSSFASGVERFARADPIHAVDSSVWDLDPFLLGTPGGTVDLRTGRMSPAKPGDHITKLTGCAPEHGPPELWLQFLRESVSDDEPAMRFVQQWFGYALTGDTSAHALLYVHGDGGNGKSVWLNTLAAVLGDYAATAAMETFVASRNDRHSTELAMLRGARLVTASETEEGRAWAESRIKALTGGDPITARFMHKDNFTFRPQFKLTIVGNHAPQLTNVDDAMRRRFNILPFVNKPAAPDRLLETKLRAEHGRILAWAIAGCRDWQTSGLVRPAAVRDATAEYFEAQDLFGQWIAERCETSANRWELPAKLFRSWAEYARAAGDEPGSARTLSDRLGKRGFRSAKSNGLRIYRGLSIRDPEYGRDASDA